MQKDGVKKQEVEEESKRQAAAAWKYKNNTILLNRDLRKAKDELTAMSERVGQVNCCKRIVHARGYEFVCECDLRRHRVVFTRLFMKMRHAHSRAKTW